MFGPVGSMGFGGEFARAYTHGFANGMISQFTGGDFMSGFVSGGLGSLAGSAFMMYGGKLSNSVVGTYAFSGLAGGVGAELTGGNFWEGAGIGLMTAGLNHLQNSLTRLPEKGWHTFKSEEEAYQYMWEASHKNGYAYVLKNGKVVLPVDQNSSTGSYHYSELLTTNKDGTYTLKYKGKVAGYTHTHSGSTSMNVSGADKSFMNRFPNMTFKTIANGGIIYQVWSSGNYKQIGTVKNW